MSRLFFLATLVLLPVVSLAQDRSSLIADIVDNHIVSGFDALKTDAATLALAAQDTCDVHDPTLRAAYKDAFLSWTRVSHLRFGPTEEENRGFALAFWPDPRGKTPKTLAAVISGGDASLLDPVIFKQQSVAIRGFYALDFLLFDPGFSDIGASEFRCSVMRAVTGDIASTSAELSQAWGVLADDLKSPDQQTTYRTEEEVLRVLFKSASGGMQFTSEMRLARPLGTFDRPRPKRAEARRSELSRDLVLAAVEGAGALAIKLARTDEKLAMLLTEKLADITTDLNALDDPAFAGVDTPQGRFVVETIQTAVDDLRTSLDQQLGPHLGVSAGFNSLDGD